MAIFFQINIDHFWQKVAFLYIKIAKYLPTFCQNISKIINIQTKNPNLGKFWRVLQLKMLVYFMDIWYVYFVVIWHIFPVLVF
jgi:hypothetical protein